MENKLRVYETLHCITKKATMKEIENIQESIDDPINEMAVDLLKTRKKELEYCVEQLEKFEDED